MLQCLLSDRFSVTQGKSISLENLYGGLIVYEMVYEYSNNIIYPQDLDTFESDLLIATPRK